jgi:hypothetical protein
MPLFSGMYATPTAAIASGGTKSGAIAFADFTRGMFILPATFTGVAMTFEVSVDGINFTLYDLAAITVAQGKAYALPAGLAGAGWIKLVSGSAETPGRSIQLMLKY